MYIGPRLEPRQSVSVPGATPSSSAVCASVRRAGAVSGMAIGSLSAIPLEADGCPTWKECVHSMREIHHHHKLGTHDAHSNLRSPDNRVHCNTSISFSCLPVCGVT